MIKSSDLAQTVRTGRPSASLREGSEYDNRPARAMTAAMDAYARTRGLELAHRLDLEGVRTLLDIGCGPGTYSLALLKQHPALHAILLDDPAQSVLDALSVPTPIYSKEESAPNRSAL